MKKKAIFGGLILFALVVVYLIWDDQASERSADLYFNRSNNVFANQWGGHLQIASIEIFHQDKDDGHWKSYSDLKKSAQVWMLTDKASISRFLSAVETRSALKTDIASGQFVGDIPTVVYQITCWNINHELIASGQWDVFDGNGVPYAFVRADNGVNSGWGAIIPNTALGDFIHSLEKRN